MFRFIFCLYSDSGMPTHKAKDDNYDGISASSKDCLSSKITAKLEVVLLEQFTL